MATLSVIAEPFPDSEAPLHAAAAHDLTAALADTAPRGCSARFLVARDSEAPTFVSPRIAVESLPLRANSLPVVWQSGAAARPLDGEMSHSVTAMMPLRTRAEDDGTQSTVTVPNVLMWQAPELMHPAHLRLMRSFVKRAAKQADVIITGTHAMAELLQEQFSFALPVQVITPSAPAPLLAGADAAERRARLGLPDRYLVTTAHDDDYGRLRWVFDAYEADTALPDLVIITGLDPAAFVKRRGGADAGESAGGTAAAIPPALAGRVHLVASTDLHDAGAALSGATLLLQPQAFSPTGYTVIAALMSRVPVLHAGDRAVAELALDAGITAADRDEFVAAVSRLVASARTAPDLPTGDVTSAPGELELLTVHAGDRGRTFSWNSTAWQLWETHAAI